MNEAHKLGIMRNRLKRLKRRVKDAGVDKQGMMLTRIRELEEILRENEK